MRIAIAMAQVPFLAGGAEALAAGLRRALLARGDEAEIVTLPFRFFPAEEVRRGMRAWEAEDFTSLNMYEPELVIGLKFPAYAARHPRKVLWLLHQHRAAYELLDAAASEVERAVATEVAGFDARHIAAIPRRFTISARVSDRLRRNNGIDSVPLYHPPPMEEAHYAAEAQPYVFFPSRFEHAKRQELLVRAASLLRGPGHVVFAGEGGQIGPMRELVDKLGAGDRVRILGRVTSEEMIALYARATAICFPPLDEDYGYVTLEAMLSAKPVITCSDSGGPLEFVVDGETGSVVAPEPAAIAAAIETLMAQPARAARLGRNGLERYRQVVPGWNTVVDTLLAER